MFSFWLYQYLRGSSILCTLQLDSVYVYFQGFSMFKNNSDSLNLTAELLGLADIEVTHVQTNLPARMIKIEVKSTKKEALCRSCSKPTKGHGYGRKLSFRHLPISGLETIIEIKPRRGICLECNGHITTTETLDWYDRKAKFTKPFEQHLLFELVNSTIADVSRKESVDYHAVEVLIDRYVETEIDFNAIQSLGVLGIDEISLKKGYRDFVTLITYRIDNKVHVLGVVKGREKNDIIDFLEKVPVTLRQTVLAVCCDLYDLYDGYMNACQQIFKNTPIVADRFHVRKLYRKSLINLRKSELIRLKKDLPVAEYKALKPAIKLLRKQKDYFTEEDKMIVEILFIVSPKLKLAYRYSRVLSGIFDSHITAKLAKEKMTQWMTEVSSSELTCFNRFIKTLTKSSTAHPLKTAYLFTLNSKKEFYSSLYGF